MSKRIIKMETQVRNTECTLHHSVPDGHWYELHRVDVRITADGEDNVDVYLGIPDSEPQALRTVDPHSRISVFDAGWNNENNDGDPLKIRRDLIIYVEDIDNAPDGSLVECWAFIDD